MNKLCILEICPSKRVNNINMFDNSGYEHYFITHDKENIYSDGFNYGKSWGDNRNKLYDITKENGKYEYYMFLDYDLILKHNDINKNPIEEIVNTLNTYKPIMYRVSGFGDDLKKTNGLYVGGFITHGMTIIRHDVMDLVFPIVTRYGGFWDSASWINTILVPIFNDYIIVDYNMSAIHKQTTYTPNPNYKRGNEGLKAMNDLYLETKKIYKEGIFQSNNVHEFKNNYMKNRFKINNNYTILESPQKIIDRYYNIKLLEKMKNKK